ncbi:MAG: phosphoribosyltransferase family protein [Bacillota bacterium]|nr:phosphoribosyltransferase family protein [Bacillota bacterium]
MNTKEYNVLDLIHMQLEIRNNRYNLPTDLIYSIGARINKKRRYLFVSKVLGKHIPVRNANSLLTGALLAYKFLEDYYSQYNDIVNKIAASLINSKDGKSIWREIAANPIHLDNKILFLAFAETATSLGHSIFNCFENSCFIHTTRENIPCFKNPILFEEEHSHATSHRIYPLNYETLKLDSPIVLIDDEISTGKTVLNIIKELDKIHKRKEYVVLSILDFRSKADIEYARQFEKEYSLKVNFISLISGEFTTSPTKKLQNWGCVDKFLESNITDDSLASSRKPSDTPPEIRFFSLGNYFNDFISAPSFNDAGEENPIPYLKASGRFGIDSEEWKRLSCNILQVSKFIEDKITGTRILFLGTEEFMHIPLYISCFIDKDIYYHSTTRSPIFPSPSPDYPVNNRFVFSCPPNPVITNFVYNIPYGFYDEVYVFFERGFKKTGLTDLLEVVSRLGVKKATILSCSGHFV